MNTQEKPNRQLKKSVKRLVSQEVSNRGLLPRRTRYQHVKPQKVGQIWAADFTELTVYGERFKFGVLIDVADQYYLGSCVEKRANVALVNKPVQQALAALGNGLDYAKGSSLDSPTVSQGQKIELGGEVKREGVSLWSFQVTPNEAL